MESINCAAVGARDTKLDRDVAPKVLPEAFTQDPDRLARFEREAKVLASLNHPNIAAIQGLEESDGVRALVVLRERVGVSCCQNWFYAPTRLVHALIAKSTQESGTFTMTRGVADGIRRIDLPTDLVATKELATARCAWSEGDLPGSPFAYLASHRALGSMD